VDPGGLGHGRPGKSGVLSKVERLFSDRPQGGFSHPIGRDL